MKRRRRSRRAGATETFSVSVDPATKRALRQLADHDYGGNLSALVSDLAAGGWQPRRTWNDRASRT